ncbi:MAG TPA: 50S ribosomal protein L25 [Gemmatimonadales bacterium]|jgi:large subunit ribosomal protein L25
MAEQVKLAAATRTATGKGAARVLRRAGKLPAVIYGHDRPAEPLALDAGAVERMLITMGSAAAMIDVTVDDREPVRALIREVQRDPLRPSDVIHLDLYEVRADQKITVEVPVHLVGIPDGVRNHGGVLDHLLHRLEIEVFPADLPDHIEVDVNALAIGHQVFVRDVTVPKAEILNDPDQPVCTVVPPRTEVVEEPVVPETETVEPELIRKPKAEEEEAAEE